MWPMHTRLSAPASGTSYPVRHSMMHHLDASGRRAALQGADPAAINAELLAKNDEVVPLLLAFLKDGPQGALNFYVRYHTVQLLTALAAGGPYRLQRVSLLTCQACFRMGTTADILAEQVGA